MSENEKGMGATEERRFHTAQDRINLKVESRLTRLEIMLYLLISLSAINLVGIHIIDTITLWHP